MEPGPSNKIVRTFSDELQEKSPRDGLSRGLAAKVAVDRHRERHPSALQQQWSLFLLDAREMALSSVPDEEVVLLEQSRKLYAAWDKFLQGLPKEQRQDLVGKPPNLRYLYNAVEKASNTWQDDREGQKRGRLKQVFSDLCGSFRDHSNLLKVIPSDDKYICLLTGSLSAIAQASINHQEIANSVSDGLKQLSQDMAFWNRQMAVHGDVKMMHTFVHELYVVVFEFLTDLFTNWSKSSWKRFITSFDEKAFDKLFADKRKRMHAIEKRMKREANLEFQRKMLDRMDKMAAGQETMHQAMANKEQALQYQQNLILSLGTKFQQFLEQQYRPALEFSEDDSSPVRQIEAPEPVPIDATEPIQIEAPEPVEMEHFTPPPEQEEPLESTFYRREDVLANLKSLAYQVQRDMQTLVDMTSRASQLTIHAQVHGRLLRWTKEPRRDRLWIQGPHGVSSPSQNTLTAVSLVALSRQTEIPCLWYFCSLKNGPPAAPFSYPGALMDMLRSLITQLALLLPDQFSSLSDLSSTRLSRLERDDVTVEDALDLLRDLRMLAPSYLHCIIDSVQILENRNDPQYTQSFLRVLARLCTLDDEASQTNALEEVVISMTTKICMTTDGYVDGLGQIAAADAIAKLEYSAEAEDPVVEEAVGFTPHWT